MLSYQEIEDAEQVFAGKWERKAEYHGYTPEPHNPCLERRVVVKKDEWYILAFISRPTDSFFTPRMGEYEVKWDTTSLQQCTNEELGAVLRHERKLGARNAQK
jgi:hypothetical protein